MHGYGILDSAVSVAEMAAAIFTGVAAAVTWLTVREARRQVVEQAKARELEMRPVLGYVKHNRLGKEGDLDPGIRLYFSNLGKGAAQVMALVLNCSMWGQIGSPISIGVGATCHIDLRSPNWHESLDLKLSLYYWDVGKTAHRTQLNVDIRRDDNQVFVVSDEAVCLGALEKPARVQHWPGGLRIATEWWE